MVTFPNLSFDVKHMIQYEMVSTTKSRLQSLIPQSFEARIKNEDSCAHSMVNARPSDHDDCWGRNNDHILSQNYNLLEHKYGWTFFFIASPNHIPLEYRCPIKASNRFGHVYVIERGIHDTILNFSTTTHIHPMERWKHSELFKHFCRCVFLSVSYKGFMASM